MITTTLPTRVDKGGKAYRRVKGIENFGKDNLYPNNSFNMYESSGALASCIDTYQAFIEGRGMTTDDQFWKAKINQKGLRTDQLHWKLTMDYAIHNGFALLVHYNALYEKVGIFHIPFEFCRLGARDDEGNVNKIHVYDKWDEVMYQNRNVREYDIYNSDPDVIQSQVDAAGGWDKWKGQVWYNGEAGELAYPVNSYEQVREDVATDYLIKRRKNANITSNFAVTNYIEYPFKFASDEERTLEKEKYKEIMNSDNSGSIMIIENDSRDVNGQTREVKVHKLSVPNLDKLYEHTESSVQENIRRRFKIPEILMNAVSTGFSSEIMQHAYTYYNNITESKRRMFEQVYLELFRGYYRGINPAQNYEIIPLRYDLN